MSGTWASHTHHDGGPPPSLAQPVTSRLRGGGGRPLSNTKKKGPPTRIAGYRGTQQDWVLDQYYYDQESLLLREPPRDSTTNVTTTTTTTSLPAPWTLGYSWNVSKESLQWRVCHNHPNNDPSTTKANTSTPTTNTTALVLAWNSQGQPLLQPVTEPVQHSLLGLPIYGLFGVYSVPSGHVWVWIAGAEAVYSAPSPHHDHNQNNGNSDALDSWWTIAKVTRLQLVHVPFSSSTTTPPSSQEARQVRLLRQALQDHDWYFCPRPPRSSSSTDHHPMVISDMTRSLQDNIAQRFNQQAQPTIGEDNTINNHHNINDNDNDDESLLSTLSFPDERFFWNQAVLEPVWQASLSSSGSHSRDWIRSVLVPVTSAFVGISTPHDDTDNNNDNTNTASLSYHQLVVSRRSKWRAGTRFTKRGANGLGQVANYAETEQVVLVPTTTSKMVWCASHLQVRGSIPLHWSSPSDIKTYRPKVRIGTNPLAQARALRHHLLDLVQRHVVVVPSVRPRPTTTTIPSLVLLNLVDQKHDQGRLGRTMDAVLQAVLNVYETNLPSISNNNNNHTMTTPPDEWTTRMGETENDSTFEAYGVSQNDHHHTLENDHNDPFLLLQQLNSQTIHHEWFDFHAKVKGGKWDVGLESLWQTMKPMVQDHSYFCASLDMNNNNDEQEWHVYDWQTGIVRTNCMDCLDRTNVVQGLFAKHVLEEQLDRVATQFGPNDSPLWTDASQVAHRLLWADNADAMSRLYAGTPALKGDYTRTGQRTKKGALDDGVNSVQRYYLNNFMDADRQEGIDLLLGDVKRPFGDTDDDDDMVDMEQDDTNTGTPLDFVRSLLTGASPFSAAPSPYAPNGNRGSEMNHPGLSSSSKFLSTNGGALASTTHSSTTTSLLQLPWLPGDLRGQVQNLVALHASTPTEQDSLRAMDHRAARDQPWWVVTEDETDEEEPQKTTLEPNSNETTEGMDSSFSMSHNHPHLLGAVLAVTFLWDSSKGPYLLAALVMGISGWALSE